MKNQAAEFWVGVLMILGILALLFLALRVSGLAFYDTFLGNDSYSIKAEFNNIGSLKPRSPVRMAGVEIGTVTSISLDPQSYWARVTMRINGNVDNIPVDSLAKITASGLLGDNFVSIQPGASSQSLHNGGTIVHTYGATDILSLLSTFGQSLGNKSSSEGAQAANTIKSGKKSPFEPVFK